jgi:hypothetical protein
MLVVKIQLWPYGAESAAYPIAEIRIVNDGTGDVYVGNYDVSSGEVRARVEGHERSGGAAALVRKAIDALEAQRTIDELCRFAKLGAAMREALPVDDEASRIADGLMARATTGKRKPIKRGPK